MPPRRLRPETAKIPSAAHRPLTPIRRSSSVIWCYFVAARMQKEKEQLLRQDYESPRSLKSKGLMAAIFLAVLTGILIFVLFDPLGWLAGSPAVHDAKKYIALSIGAILLPCVGGIWFLVIAPVRWGVITSFDDHLVFRSEEPGRFWSL